MNLTDRAGGYISKIVFNDGNTIEIEKNDIVIFVGPNNAGKSQSLKDIYKLSRSKTPCTVISNVEITKYNGSLVDMLNRVSNGCYQDSHVQYNVLGHTITLFAHSENRFKSDLYFSDFRDLFVVNLDTTARLSICNAPSNITRTSPKTHPIHYAAFNGDYRKWLSDSFKKAFGIDMIPNTQYGSLIPLCIGSPVKLNDEYVDEQARQEAYAEILEKYIQAQEQGDGIRSFTGILLYLMLDYFCTYLIDEPESFLHPPQARIMGQIIGQTLSDQQQAFISTHSEDIIKGLMEVCPERIKIVRITRDGDINAFATLKNSELKAVWNDSLLKHSNIMSSLFYKSVVLCESDSDCKIYSLVESYIRKTEGKYSETLFIHCGGKHRMAKIARALLALKINVKLIPDIDILNDETIFKEIIETFGINWDNIYTDYNTVVSNLHSTKESINRNDAKTAINRILESSNSNCLSNNEIREIRTIIKTISKWENIKTAGIAALPAGNATVSYNKMNEILNKNGIFVVPVGELERFIKEVGGHGPEWVNSVLESYPELDDPVYNGIRDFIISLNL